MQQATAADEQYTSISSSYAITITLAYQ